MKHKIVMLITFAFIACTFVGCSTNTNIISTDITNESRTVYYEKDSLYTEIINVISGEVEPTNYKFESYDIIYEPVVNNYYYFRDSVYVQIGNSMYRFQLDNNHKIKSYIKYGLEA